MSPEEIVQAGEDALAEFERTRDPAALQRAADATGHLEPMGADGFDERRALRLRKLALYARLLDRIDRETDPDFDPHAPPEGPEHSYQSRLRDVARRTWAGAETYVRRCFLRSPQSRAELSSVVREHVSDAARAEQLRQILGPAGAGR